MSLAILLAYQLWTKAFPLWVYLASSAALAIIVGLSLLIYRQHRSLVIIQVFFVSLLIMHAYYLATHYAVLPWGDPYGQYWVLSTSLQDGKVSLSPEYAGERAVTSLYNGWPGIHFVGAALAEVGNVAPLEVAMFLPWALFVAFLLLAYLLLRELASDFSSASVLLPFSLLILVTSPFLNEGVPPLYKYQYMAVVLLLGFFYLAHRHLHRPSPVLSLLLIIVTAALVITHHYTSFLAVLFLFILALILTLASRYSEALGRRGFLAGAYQFAPFFMLGVIAVVFLFLWWNEAATVIWPYVSDSIEKLSKILRSGAAEPAIWETGYTYPTPWWAVAILVLRDVLMFGGAVLGFALIVVRRRYTPTRLFIISAVLVLAIPVLADAVFKYTGPPYRAIGIFMPFVAFCAGFFYTQLASRLAPMRYVPAAILVGVAALFVFSSMIGLWGNRYIPQHLYNPSVSWVQGGEHPTEWRRLESYLDGRVTYEKVDMFLTDERYAMGLILPMDQWDKIEVVGTQGVDLSPGSLVVAFRGLDPDSYIEEVDPSKFDSSFEPEKFQESVSETSSRIYDDGSFQIWRR
ncbi:MAG: hypothetical protein MUP14_00530 [Dehalococcoidia bacterium]|nr:hypothetical protein [Dehalococcoidia bacterium]